jgi:CHAT domain-containing protein/Tfp pilus assembly protein PilF
VGFGKERVRLLELYAKLCWREAASRSQVKSVEDILRRQTYEGSALWALKKGIEVADRRGLETLKMRLRLNLCDLYEAVGDRNNQADELQTALSESQAAGDDAITWRIYWRVGKFLLGEGMATKGFGTKPALDWFKEAMTLWEDLPDDPSDLGGKTLSKAEFKRMLTYAFTSALREGKADDLTSLAQNITSAPLLQEVRSREIRVNRERRKVIWGGGGGSVPYYRRAIAQLKRRRAESIRKVHGDSAAVIPEDERIRRIEREYDDLLAEVRRNDPEFASLFSLVTFPADSIRTVLDHGDAAAQIILTDDAVYGLWIDADSTSISALSGNEESTSEKTVLFLREKTEGSTGLRRLFLVLPENSNSTVFKPQLQSRTNRNAPLPVYLLPDLQSLVFLEMNRSLGRGQAFSLTDKIKTDLLKTVDLDDESAVSDLFEQAGTILIAPEAAEVGNELDRILFSGGGSDWRVKDLFRLDTQAEALIVLGKPGEEMVLVRAAFLAGFSNVIFLPGNPPRETLNKWLDVFFRTKPVSSVGQAFDTACAAVRNDAEDDPFNSSRLYGDGGFDREEKIAFARERFAATVQKGNYNLEQGDGEWALRYYRRALALAEEIGNENARRNLFNLIIQAARKAEKWEEAIAAQQELIADARKRNDPPAVETGLRNLSVYFSRDGRFRQAAEVRLRARDLAKNAGKELRAAQDDRILATYYERAGDLSSALKVVREAAGIFRDWEEMESYVSCRVYQARILMAQEDFSRALETLLKTTSDRNAKLSAQFYQYLGLAYEGINDYANARRSYLKALDVASEQPSLESALTHQYLAGIYWKTGRYQEGLDQIAVAKRQFSTLNLERYYYLCQNAEALIHLSLGDADRALEIAKQALEGAIRSDDLKSRSQIEKNIGLILLSIGNPEKARDRFAKSLELDLQTGSTRNQAYAYLDLGGAYLQMNESDSADASFAKALELGKASSEKRVLAKAYLGMGWVALSRDDVESADKALQQASIISDQLGSAELQWRVDLARGEAAERRRDTDRALEALQRAMTRVEEIRSSLALESRRAGFMEDKQEIYQRAAWIHLKRGEIEAAFDVIERARSRSFLDLVGSRKSLETAGLDSAAKEAVKNISEQSAVLERKLAQLRYKGKQRTPEEDAKFEELQVRLDSLKSAWAAELDRLEAAHPGYRDLVSVEPLPAGEIQSLLKPGETLLEYYPVLESVAVFALTFDRISARVIPVSSDTLRMQTEKLRRRLEKKLDIGEESLALYQALIAPVSDWIPPESRLIIVPSGVLHYLPFALLKNADEDYLIDSHSLSYAPSANIFAFCRRQAQEKEGLESAPPAAFGDPRTDLPLENLFFSGKEIESLAYSYPETRLFRGEQAEEAKVSKVGKEASALHFSAHGLFDARNPSFSSLFLAAGDGADGRLRMFEIFDLDLAKCRWVTLSACESGLGGLAGGDEIVGFNRAFIYAGSPRVISSLWKVDDLATAILMKHFYRNLRAGADPTEALRRAQIHVRERFAKHPFYWAAFVLTGEATGSFAAQAASGSIGAAP